MHDHSFMNAHCIPEGRPREHPRTSFNVPGTNDEDIHRLEDLRAIAAKSLSSIERTDERFSELYREEGFHLFTAAPLIERPMSSGSKLPRHLLLVGALLIFLAGTASPFAVAGFNKAAVTPPAGGEYEPFKLYPELASIEEPVDDPSTAEGESQEHEVVIDEVDIVTSARPSAARSRPSAPSRSQTVVSVVSPLVEVRPEAPSTEGQDALSSLVDGAIGDVAPLQNGAPALPASPTRAQVLSGLRGVSTAVALCGRDHGGRVTVDVTINGPTGRVSDVRVTSGADGAEAACVSRAVRRAQFPRFTDEDFTVRSFPFTVR